MEVYFLIPTSFLITSLISLAIGISTKKFIKINQKDILRFFVVGLLLCFYGVSFYINRDWLPLSLYVVIFYSSFIITTFIYSFITLKERINKNKIITLVFIFISLFMMSIGNKIPSKIDDLGLSLIGVTFFTLLGIFSGLFWGTNKKLTDRYPVIQVNFICNAIAFILSGTFFIIPMIGHSFLPLPISLSTWIGSIAFYLVSGLSLYLILYSLKNIKIQRSSIIFLLRLIFNSISFTLSMIMLHEKISLMPIIGIIIMIFTIVFSNINLKKD